VLVQSIRVEKLTASRKADFYKVHNSACCGDWCYCTAWWVPTWDGWGERTDEQNRAVREDLFAQSIFDGYLLYVNDEPKGWCQVGQRDRLEKLIRVYTLEPDPNVWAITCFSIHPDLRGEGLSHLMLQEVLKDLKNTGVVKVQAFPHLGENLTKGDIWTGPETVFIQAGFKFVRTDEKRPILELLL
jgi:hypothetical protein